MNQGVIAPGNHWIPDSLRGAPPHRPGRAIAQSEQKDPVPIPNTEALYIIALRRRGHDPALQERSNIEELL